MKKNILAIIIASVLAAICFLPLLIVPPKGTEKYDVVYFGDSIVAGDGYHDTVADYLAEYTGLDVLKAGFGGTTMSDFDLENREGYTLSAYTMYALSKASRLNDFSFAQMSYIPEYSYAGEYWGEYAQNINKLDFDSVKFVIIEQGVNDYSIGIPIENSFDRYDVQTFTGALRTVIENIRAGFKNATVIITTPTHCFIDSKYCDLYDFGGGVLKDYVDAEKEIAREYGIFVVDNYSDITIDGQNVDEKTLDGLHPKPECAREIALNVFEKAASLFETQ